MGSILAIFDLPFNGHYIDGYDMVTHLVEYVDSIERLAGMRWKKSEPAASILTKDDLGIIEYLRFGRAKTDFQLARFIYGTQAKVDGKYRKRIAALTHKLSGILLTCPISRQVGKRKNESITCIRHLAVGETLVRSNVPKSARAALTEALSKMNHPELCWYVPPVHLALANYEGVNGRGPSARRHIALARAATKEAVLVSTILELWIQLSIPVYRIPDRDAQQPILAEAREVLTRLARKPLTGVVATAAARLATTISQLLQNATIGIRWLERAKKALEAEHRFTSSVALDYHTQRLFLFNTTHQYIAGAAEAKLILKASKRGSPPWFVTMSTLIHLQLKTGQYTEAIKTSRQAMAHRGIKRISSVLAGRIKLRSVYARILGSVKKPSNRLLLAVRRDVVDAAVLRTVYAVTHAKKSVAVKALMTLHKLITRHDGMRKSRDYVVFARLVRMYADNELQLAACKKITVFAALEKELNTFLWSDGDHTVIPPLLIWRAIVSRR